MISQQRWKEQEKFAATMTKPKIYQWVSRVNKKKKQVRKNKKKSILDLPVKKDEDDEEIRSFIDRQAQIIKSKQIVTRRYIKEYYNLNHAAITKLQNQITQTHSTLINFAVACERLRKLVDEGK